MLLQSDETPVLTAATWKMRRGRGILLDGDNATMWWNTWAEEDGAIREMAVAWEMGRAEDFYWKPVEDDAFQASGGCRRHDAAIVIQSGKAWKGTGASIRGGRRGRSLDA